MPRRTWLRRAIQGVVVLGLCVRYAVLIQVYFFRVPGGGFGTLQAVQQLFTSREVALAAWLHYLAFDLLVGSFIVREARSLGIGAPWRVPALALTFLFGPAGWLWFRSQVLLRGKPDPLSQV